MEQPEGFIDQTHPDFLLNLGFIASLVDTSMFLYTSGSIRIFILTNVDDILITGTHANHIDSLIQQLQQEFPLRDLGPLGFFLGIHATRCAFSLHLCQAKYILDLLNRVDITTTKLATSPCSLGSKLSQFEGTSPLDPAEYRHVVGALQYYTFTRPKIAFSINQLCQNPTSIH